MTCWRDKEIRDEIRYLEGRIEQERAAKSVNATEAKIEGSVGVYICLEPGPAGYMVFREENEIFDSQTSENIQFSGIDIGQ